MAKNSNGQIGRLKKLAEVLGLPQRTVRRLDKLNDLIPDLQKLLASGKWDATTVACIIRSLPQEEQGKLFGVLGGGGTIDLSIAGARRTGARIPEKG